MYHPLDHVFVIVFAVLWPLYGLVYRYPRLQRDVAAGRADARPIAYREGMALEWFLALTLMVGWLLAGRSVGGLGLLVPGGWRLPVAIVLVAAVAILLTVQRRRILGDEALRKQMLGGLAAVRALLPSDRRELRYFYVLSASAGVCEELLYRGYLLWYLEQSMGIVMAVVVSSLAFGIAHSYQGVKGVVQTTVIGLIFAVTYVLLESLIVPVLIHALVDMNSGALAHGLIRAEAAAVDDGEATAAGT